MTDDPRDEPWQAMARARILALAAALAARDPGAESRRAALDGDWAAMSPEQRDWARPLLEQADPDRWPTTRGRRRKTQS